MKTNHTEYFNFFAKWLKYQFPTMGDEENNKRILLKAATIVTNDEDAAEWGDRDCWTMYDMANKQ